MSRLRNVSRQHPVECSASGLSNRILSSKQSLSSRYSGGRVSVEKSPLNLLIRGVSSYRRCSCGTVTTASCGACVLAAHRRVRKKLSVGVLQTTCTRYVATFRDRLQLLEMPSRTRFSDLISGASRLEDERKARSRKHRDTPQHYECLQGIESAGTCPHRDQSPNAF